MKATLVAKALNALATKEKALVSARFFKTKKGQYGHGDAFIGVTVPEQRIVAKQFEKLPLEEVEKLLLSKIHEYRLTALLILGVQFRKAKDAERGKIARFYIKNIRMINNWDLVDASAPYILGGYLQDKDRNVLYEFAKSDYIWKRRIAIISTYNFIKKNEFKDTLAISEILLDDTHDLIHKAVGWMLREVGKKNEKVLKDFLEKYAATMPRTALRYAIEKLSPKEKLYYMKKERE